MPDSGRFVPGLVNRAVVQLRRVEFDRVTPGGLDAFARFGALRGAAEDLDTALEVDRACGFALVNRALVGRALADQQEAGGITDAARTSRLRAAGDARAALEILPADWSCRAELAALADRLAQ